MVKGRPEIGHKHYSHYHWLEDNFNIFLNNLGINPDTMRGSIIADGDKCYSYRFQWEQANIPFPHGVAIYLLTYRRPWCNEVRETPTGWVPVEKWIIENYPRFQGAFRNTGEWHV
jgi:hypothetical protein